MKLEYDGTEYGGSQFQANAPSIQAELERAAEPLAGRRVRVAFAGRTDAGVHAEGQVATLRLPRKWDAATVQKALNARLPVDIVVAAAVEAPADFDPRRCALWRRYRYLVLEGGVRSPLRRRWTWQMWQKLDLAAMQQAAAALEGEHDFAAFAGPVDPPGASTVRQMRDVTVERSGRLVRFEFEADAFLPHQVRRTVGMLVEVGRGRADAVAVGKYLQQGPPGAAGPAAPARGLCLVRVAYDGVRFEVGEDG